MKPYTITALAAACLFALPAYAQTSVQETTVRQTQDPVTGTTTETTTTTTTEFVDLDADRDGFVIVSEAAKNPEFSKVWVQYDKNGDKKITRVEYDAYRAIAVKEPVASTTTTTTTTTRREFVDFDTDADGYIVVSEIPADDEFAKVYVKYDKDGDKKITRTEYDAWYTVQVDAD